MSGTDEQDDFLKEFLRGLKEEQQQQTNKKKKINDQSNSNNRNERDDEMNEFPKLEINPKTVRMEGKSVTTSRSEIFIFKPTSSGRVWVYDEQENIIRIIAGVSVNKYYYVPVVLLDKNIVLIGGETSSHSLKTCDLFNVTTKKITHFADLNVERNGPGAVLLRDGRVFVVGGWSPPHTSCEILHPVNRVSIPLSGKMKYERLCPCVVSLLDGKVMVLGGRGKKDDEMEDDSLNSTEIYDPITDSFQDGPHMLNKRYGFTATTLLNGEVLVCGGNKNEGCSSEIYNWHTNSFREGPPMIKYRRFHFANLLSDGRVLICHDDTESYDEGSSEIFDPTMYGLYKGGFVEGPSFPLW